MCIARAGAVTAPTLRGSKPAVASVKLAMSFLIGFIFILPKWKRIEWVRAPYTAQQGQVKAVVGETGTERPLFPNAAHPLETECPKNVLLEKYPVYKYYK